MKTNTGKLIYIPGLIGAGTIIIGALVTALFYHGSKGESYSFLNHFISELGQRGVSDLAWVFNICLIIGGIFLAFFMFELGVYIGRWYSYLAAAVGVVTGIAASLVGVFPMNNMDYHVPVAMTFFRGGLAAISLFTLIIIFDTRQKISRWLVIPGVITVAAFAIFLIMPKILGYSQGKALSVPDIRPEFWLNPFLEWMVFFTILAWIITMSVYLINKSKSG